MYLGIYITYISHLTTMNEERGYDYKKENEGKHKRVCREQREGGHDMII